MKEATDAAGEPSVASSAARSAESVLTSSAGEYVASPAFKRPMTPGSRSVQTIERGFTLKRGRLTVYEPTEETPKRMSIERSRFEEGKASRTSPGFAFRVGPSGSAPTESPSESSPTEPPAGTPLLPVAADIIPWSRTLLQVQEGRGKSPFSAYVDSLTPLPPRSQGTGLMQKHSTLLPSPIEGIQPLALTPADGTPSQGREDAAECRFGLRGADGGAGVADGTSAGRAVASDGHRDTSSPGDSARRVPMHADDAARKGHGPRRLQLPNQGRGNPTAEMVERIVSDFEQPGLHQPMGAEASLDVFAAESNVSSLQALFDDASMSALGIMRPSVSSKSRSKSRLGRPKSCNCKNSKCLKLYCDCFSANKYCDGCKCTDCLNNKENESGREEARQSVLKRNPRAFNAKFKLVESPSKESSSTRHVKGCNCRNSRCLKNYCECFQMGVECNAKCKCTDCANGREESPPEDGVLARYAQEADTHSLFDDLDLTQGAADEGDVGAAQGNEDRYSAVDGLLEMHGLVCNERVVDEASVAGLPPVAVAVVDVDAAFG